MTLKTNEAINDNSMNNVNYHKLFILELFHLIALIIFCMLLGSFITQAISHWIYDVDIQELQKDRTASSIVEHKNIWLQILMMGNLSTFLLPGLLFSFFVYKKKWLNSVSAHIFPQINSLLLGGLVMIISLPFIQFTFLLNQKIPLPNSLIQMESNSNEMLTHLLSMNSPLELFINLFIFAFIPAMGEEWIFRGFLQKRLIPILKNKHIAILITAIIFSAIHFQFQGFIPRVVLGLILGYLFLWSGSLWLAIFAHFIYNGFQVVGFYFASSQGITLDVGEAQQIPFYAATISFFLVLGIMYIIKKQNDNSSLLIQKNE